MRLRIAATVALLASTALINALVPLLFARADRCAGPGAAALAAPAAIVLAYVAVQWLAKVLNELRWSLYGPIEQRTRRRLARTRSSTCTRCRWASTSPAAPARSAGSSSNGLNGARELLFDAVFLILPLVAEILFVTVDHAGPARPRVRGHPGRHDRRSTAAALVTGSEWLRAHQRTAVAEASTAHGKAVDSLLNYETVKYFGNERHVAERYDAQPRRGRAADGQGADLPQPDRRPVGHHPRRRHRPRSCSWRRAASRPAP